MYSFTSFESVQYSISNCLFLTCIQVSQETDKVVWYSHLFKFLHIVVIHISKLSHSQWSRSMYFLEFPCFFYAPTDTGNLVPLPLQNPAFTSGSSWNHLNLTKYNNLENGFDTYLKPYSDFASFRCVRAQIFSFMQIYHILVCMTINIVNMQTIPSLSSLLLLFYNHTYFSSFWAFLVAQTVNSSNLFSLSRTLSFQTAM